MAKLLSVLAALAVAFGIAMWAAPVEAAKVGGTTISQGSIDADLAALAASPGYLCYLNAQEAIRTSGQSTLPSLQSADAKDAYSTAFTSSWLSSRITGQLLVNQAEAKGLKLSLAKGKTELVGAVSTAYQQVAGSQLACSYQPAAVVAALPSSFVEHEAMAQAASTALLNDQRAQQPEAYFNAHRADFDRICLSGILVSDAATAQKVSAALSAGDDFATLAGQYSLDASKAKGGDLGCFSPGDQSYTSASGIAARLELGKPSTPQAMQTGSFAIFLLRERTPSTYEAAKQAVAEALLTARGSATQSDLAALEARTTISVNPRYGRWTVTANGSGINPPASPPAGSLLVAPAS